jgi:hypothetical protein
VAVRLLIVAAATIAAEINVAEAQNARIKRASKEDPELTRGRPVLAVGEHRQLLETIGELRRASRRPRSTKPRVGDSLSTPPDGGDGGGAGGLVTVCDDCTIGNIVCDRTVSGFLTAGDCVLTVDDSFVNVWRFEITTTTDLTIRLTSRAFNTFLLLVDSACMVFDVNDDCTEGAFDLSCITTTLAPGTYFIVANALFPGATGGYELSVSCGGDAPDDDICRSRCVAGPATCDATIRGSLDPGDCALSSDGSLVDTYELTLTAPRTLRINLLSASFDPILAVLDEACAVVASNDDCTPNDFDRSCLTIDVPAGIYFVAVNSFNPAGFGAYTLTLFECGEPDSPCQECLAGPVACSVPVSGDLMEDDCVFEDGGAFDVWSFDMPNDGRATIQLASTAFDPFLALVARNCTDVIASNDDCQDGNLELSCLSLDLAAGRYFIFTSNLDLGQIGSYTLTVNSEICEVPTTPCQDCEVGVIDCDVPVTATLGSQRCTIDDRRPIDYWRLDIDDETPATIHLESTDGTFNPILVLFDADCNEIMRNDDCAEGAQNSCLDVTLAAGTYHVAVSSFFDDEVGEYALFVDCGGVNLTSVPGDCNGNGGIELTDAVCLFAFLFVGDPNSPLPCGDGTLNSPDNVTLLNWNGDPSVNLTDGIGVLNYLFSGGAPPFLGLERCLSLPTCPSVCVP